MTSMSLATNISRLLHNGKQRYLFLLTLTNSGWNTKPCIANKLFDIAKERGFEERTQGGSASVHLEEGTTVLSSALSVSYSGPNPLACGANETQSHLISLSSFHSQIFKYVKFQVFMDEMIRTPSKNCNSMLRKN